MIEQKKIRIFYDGTCGFCNKFVRFILTKIQRDESVFFNSQEGPRFANLKNQFSKITFPDSIAVYIEKENKVVFKGQAFVAILYALKWPWKGLAILLDWIPITIINFSYDGVAKIRHKLFKQPSGVCFPIPQQWKKLFED